MGLIRWLADQIQSTTGEKERRERTARMHDLADEFKEKSVGSRRKIKYSDQRIQQLDSEIECGSGGENQGQYCQLESRARKIRKLQTDRGVCG